MNGPTISRQEKRWYVRDVGAPSAIAVRRASNEVRLRRGQVSRGRAVPLPSRPLRYLQSKWKEAQTGRAQHDWAVCAGRVAT